MNYEQFMIPVLISNVLLRCYNKTRAFLTELVDFLLQTGVRHLLGILVSIKISPYLYIKYRIMNISHSVCTAEKVQQNRPKNRLFNWERYVSLLPRSCQSRLPAGSTRGRGIKKQIPNIISLLSLLKSTYSLLRSHTQCTSKYFLSSNPPTGRQEERKKLQSATETLFLSNGLKLQLFCPVEQRFQGFFFFLESTTFSLLL